MIFWCTMLKQLDYHIKYKKLQLKVHTILKNQVKNIQNINVKPKTLKLLEDNRSFLCPWVKQTFLRYNTKSIGYKKKTGQIRLQHI